MLWLILWYNGNGIPDYPHLNIILIMIYSCEKIILDLGYYPHVDIFSRVYYSHFSIFSYEHNPHYPKLRRIGSWSGLCALYAPFSSNLGSGISTKNPAIPLFFSIRSHFIALMLYLSSWMYTSLIHSCWIAN